MALIVYMAYSLDKRQEKLKDFMAGFFPTWLFWRSCSAILLKQHDMGAALTMGTVALVCFLPPAPVPGTSSDGGRWQLPFVWYLVVTEAYRMRRITAFLDPWQDPTDSGFQIIQSWLAFGTGGIFGQGLGEGKQKLFYLPEAHTDFILSVVGEELGFIGVLVIAAMFLLLVQRSIRVALAPRTISAGFLPSASPFFSGMEAFINMGGCDGHVADQRVSTSFHQLWRELAHH